MDETTVATENQTSEKKKSEAQKDPILRDMKIVSDPNKNKDAVVDAVSEEIKTDNKTGDKILKDKITDPINAKIDEEK